MPEQLFVFACCCIKEHFFNSHFGYHKVFHSCNFILAACESLLQKSHLNDSIPLAVCQTFTVGYI